MRYFKATLLLGTLSAAIVVILFATGWVTTTPDQILARAFALHRPLIVVPAMQVLLIVLLSYLTVWITVDVSRPILKLIVVVAAVFLLLTGSRVFALYNIFFSPFPSVFAVVIGCIVGLFYGRSDSGTRKRVLEELFGQRISRAVFHQLLNSDIPINFPGTLQEGTIIVCEIQNHRELMDLLTPENYTAMTNLYLQTAADYLVEIGGYLDECTGESLRVVFGAPMPDEKHAARACRAALDLMVRLDNLNRECDATWQRRFDFGIGINSGEMIAAAYGGARLANFSVAGPAVEFARRLCAACGTYGCRILLGPDTYEQASETFEARPIEVVKAMGERRRIELYEVLAPKHSLSPERERSRDHFWRGVIYYREKKWDKALAEFAQARITGIPDTALDFYTHRVERCRRGEDDVTKDAMVLFTAS